MGAVAPPVPAIDPVLSWAHILAQPSANPWAWGGRWAPLGAEPASSGRWTPPLRGQRAPPGSPLLRRAQWRCEGLFAQLASLSGVRRGVTAHLVGEILDQRFEGRSEILRRAADGTVQVVAEAERADCSPASETVVHARVEADWLA